MQSVRLYSHGAVVFYFVLQVCAENIVGLTNVTSCPLGLNLWLKKTSLKSCNASNGLFYHCMRSTWDTLVEFCMVPVYVTFRDGCPQLNMKNNLQIQYTKCTVSEKCPDEDYPSYLVYKYDGCYMEEIRSTRVTRLRTSITRHSSKGSTTTDNCTTTDDTRIWGAGVTKVNGTKISSTPSFLVQYEFILGITAGVIVLLVLGLMITLIYYILKTKKQRDDVKCNVNGHVITQEERMYNEIEDIQFETSHVDPVSVTNT